MDILQDRKTSSTGSCGSGCRFYLVFKQFDTLLIGRHTFEMMAKQGNTRDAGMKTIVFSRTLQQNDYPEVTIVAGGARKLRRRCAQSPVKTFGYSAEDRSSAVFLDAGPRGFG